MAWEITAEELLARYADGERDFRGIELIQSEGVPQDSSIDLEVRSLVGWVEERNPTLIIDISRQIFVHHQYPLQLLMK